MLFTTHSMVGAAIGAASPNPLTGFLSGILSHHVIDAIPHFDQGTFYIINPGPKFLGKERVAIEEHSFSRRDWAILFIDWGVAGASFLYIFHNIPVDLWLSVSAGIIGGILPDAVDSSPLWSRELRKKSKALKKYHNFHIYFHWTVRRNEIMIGTLTQIVLIALSLYFLL